ncbi:cysteine dioxygenase [Rhodopila sp.]|jgi:predicted metal-dependent enzyme (double-stranded beta helix superfamily)|uniref:cysteine dioxygenase family protein n=1 Tax=Rhodopila sp. TaxID=2480087 RepID=UPI002CAAE921|nr:cysteine dioxygenase [Rhodopila sp.]HVZ10251.1 cysteine dioxygenase [Rhodopila sp.]
MSIARLRNAVSALTRLVERQGNREDAVLEPAREILSSLIAYDDWLPEPFAAHDPKHYRQYLLHCDPLERFSLVSFVWGPGQRTPVHDHLIWGLVGMLRGEEEAVAYTPRTDRMGLEAGPARRLRPGMVDAVSPMLGDIHTVANALADRPSISIHLYGGNIGTMRRHGFDPATGTARPFVSGYSADMVPNLWAA